MTRFIVRTLHTREAGEPDNIFIVPTPVEADSPLEAARKRFALQLPDSQRNTLALLVTEHEFSGSPPRIYYVDTAPRVVEG